MPGLSQLAAPLLNPFVWVYRRFKDRDDLIRALLLRIAGRIGEYFQQGETLEAMAEAYVDYAFARPRMFAFLFLQDRPELRRFPADFGSRRLTMLNRVADSVAEALAFCRNLSMNCRRFSPSINSVTI